MQVRTCFFKSKPVDVCTMVRAQQSLASCVNLHALYKNNNYNIVAAILNILLSYDVTVIQWITSCPK